MPKKNGIELEDLLKLKRAERPTDADWASFDGNLKRKMVRCFVKKTFSEKLCESFASKSFASYGIAVGALASAVAVSVVPSYLSGMYSPDVQQASVQSISATPLPRVNASFAVNEIPVLHDMGETLVSAQINSSDAPAIRYISSPVGGASPSPFVF